MSYWHTLSSFFGPNSQLNNFSYMFILVVNCNRIISINWIFSWTFFTKFLYKALFTNLVSPLSPMAESISPVLGETGNCIILILFPTQERSYFTRPPSSLPVAGVTNFPYGLFLLAKVGLFCSPCTYKGPESTELMGYFPVLYCLERVA